MLQIQEHLLLNWGKLLFVPRHTAWSAWSHQAIIFWNKGDNCLPTKESWNTPMYSVWQALSPVTSYRSSGPLSRNQLPEIGCYMKCLSCHCSRVKLTTVVWAWCSYRHKLEGRRVGCYSPLGYIAGKVVSSGFFVCCFGSLSFGPYKTQTNCVIRKVRKSSFYLRTQKHNVKFDGYSLPCPKNRPFQGRSTYLPNNKECNWVSHDYHKAGKNVRCKDERLHLNATSIYNLLKVHKPVRISLLDKRILLQLDPYCWHYKVEGQINEKMLRSGVIAWNNSEEHAHFLRCSFRQADDGLKSGSAFLVADGTADSPSWYHT